MFGFVSACIDIEQFLNAQVIRLQRPLWVSGSEGRW